MEKQDYAEMFSEQINSVLRNSKALASSNQNTTRTL